MRFGTPTKLPDGRYFLKIAQDDGTRCMHQVNDVKFTMTDDNQVSLNIPGDKTLFSDIDEQIVSQAKESKVSWFGKEISDDTVTSAYRKSIDLESDLSASLATIKGEVVTTVYDAQKKLIDVSTIKDVVVDALVELTGLVFTKRSFESVWKIIQMRVRNVPKPKFPREYLFKDDPEEDEPEVDL